MTATALKTRTALHAQVLNVERAHQSAVASERHILAAAQDRLQHVQKELGALKPRAVLDDAAGDRYQALILERGQLEQVIALAEHHLQNGWN